MSDPKKGPCPRQNTCEYLFHVKGCNGDNWYECPYMDKIEDLTMEARDNARDHPLKDEIPFWSDDDYDGPEVED